MAKNKWDQNKATVMWAMNKWEYKIKNIKPFTLGLKRKKELLRYKSNKQCTRSIWKTIKLWWEKSKKWRGIPYSLIGRLSVVKMSFLPKSIYNWMQSYSKSLQVISGYP